MFDAICLWLAQNYNAELHLSGLKLAGVMCSYADIAAIALFAKICALSRSASPKQDRAAVVIYRMLALCALITPGLFLPQSSATFFAVQFMVLLLPYCILMYVVATGIRPLIKTLEKYIKERGSAP
ncbi:hypothetical protein FACS1894187_18030 [Synergistales bacterium]|nr:hypothetical protein FACS1894187_18030 [Synergistales bacterium]